MGAAERVVKGVKYEDLIATTLTFRRVCLSQEGLNCISHMLANNVRAQKPANELEAILAIRDETNGVLLGLARSITCQQ